MPLLPSLWSRHDFMVGSLSSLQGFTYHDLQVYTGKREHAVHWSVQKPDGCFHMCLLSEHPLGTLCRYPIRGRWVGMCSCLVVWGFVLFNFQSLGKHCHESDSETIRMLMGNCMSIKFICWLHTWRLTGGNCSQKRTGGFTDVAVTGVFPVF